jgi:hypothetical protein
MSRIRVAVAVDEDALDYLQDVARACRALGLKHDATLTSVGVLTGSIEADRLEMLRAVPGVTAVELERDFRFHPHPRRPMS